MASILFTEIDKIEISPESEERIKNIVKKMLDLEEKYKKFKYMVMEMDKAKESNSFKEWAMANPEAPIYPTALKSRDTLREQRDQEYYAIKSAIFDFLRDEYSDLHAQYIDYQNYNKHFLSQFEHCLKIPFYKKEIDDVLNRISDILENGLLSTLSDEDHKNIGMEYKRIITFIKAAYLEEETRNKAKDTKLRQLHFIEELNLRDGYNTLSFISILTSDILEPIYTKYVDAYNEYLLKYNFIFNLNKKVEEFREFYIKQCKEEKF